MSLARQFWHRVTDKPEAQPNGSGTPSDKLGEPTKNELVKIDIDPKIRERIVIDGILTTLSNVDEAKETTSPRVKFYDEKTREYISGNVPNVITDKSIRRVSINLRDGKTRYFQQIDYIDGKPSKYNEPDKKHGSTTGLRVSAWQEIDESSKVVKTNDGKQEIRINFTGWSGGQLGHPDEASLDDFLSKKLNPQVVEAAEFTDRVIKKLGKDNISNLIYNAHSMGSGNALAAHIVSNLEGVQSTSTLLMEPVGASSQLKYIKEQMQDENSDLLKKLQNIVGNDRATEKIKSAIKEFDKEAEKNIVSIRTLHKRKEAMSFKRREALHFSRIAGANIEDGIEGVKKSARKYKPTTETFHNSNDTVGKPYFQLALPDMIIKSKGELGKLDPTHTLATIVNCADSQFFELVKIPEVDKAQAFHR